MYIYIPHIHHYIHSVNVSKHINVFSVYMYTALQRANYKKSRLTSKKTSPVYACLDVLDGSTFSESLSFRKFLYFPEILRFNKVVLFGYVSLHVNHYILIVQHGIRITQYIWPLCFYYIRCTFPVQHVYT